MMKQYIAPEISVILMKPVALLTGSDPTSMGVTDEKVKGSDALGRSFDIDDEE